MTNKSKSIGTKVESQIVNYLHIVGFSKAHRRALAGSLDIGDVLVCEGLIIEAKGGAAAENASDGQLRLWCAETEREKANAKADEAFLVVKRKGHGVGKVGSWFVVHNEAGMLTRFLLGEYVVFLKALGYTADGMKSKNSALQANGGLDERFTTGSILDQIGAN